MTWKMKTVKYTWDTRVRDMSQYPVYGQASRGRGNEAHFEFLKAEFKGKTVSSCPLSLKESSRSYTPQPPHLLGLTPSLRSVKGSVE